MRKLFLGLIVLTAFVLGCKKEPASPPPVVVPERVELSPATTSLMIGNNATLTVKYYNYTGSLATTPATGLVWSTNNASIATVSNTGAVTATGLGQAEIKVTYNAAVATALVTVVANPNALATVNITPNTIQEILLNGTVNLSAAGANSAGGAVTGLTFAWLSNATNFVTVNNTGVATAAGYGTANITATANAIQSAPLQIQVIRKGTLSGTGSTGTLKLKNIGGVIKLETTSDYSISTGAPDLRLYMTNTPNATSLTGAVQLVDLARPTEYSGAHTWNLPSGITMTNYRYIFVWCAQFGGNYGNCDLGL